MKPGLDANKNYTVEFKSFVIQQINIIFIPTMYKILVHRLSSTTLVSAVKGLKTESFYGVLEMNMFIHSITKSSNLAVATW